MVTTSFEHGVFGHIPLPGYADVFKKQFNYKLTYLPKVNLYENAPSLIDTPVLG